MSKLSRWRARFLLLLSLFLLLVAGCSGPAGPGVATPAAAGMSDVPASATHSHSGHHDHPTAPAASPALEPTAERPSAAVVWSSGSGEGVTQRVQLEPGLVLAHVDHQTASAIAVFLLNEQGEHLAMVAHNSRPISSARAYRIQHSGRYYLHVLAEDEWRAALAPAAVENLGPAAGLPATLSAEGPGVFPLRLEAGRLAVRWSYAGRLSFQPQLLRADGSRVAEFTNRTGAGSGEMSLTIDAPGLYLLDVGADGWWQIELRADP